MKTKNKFLPILLIFSMTISLIGCGSTANPAVGEDVVESTETMVESSTEATVEPSDGTTTETGGKSDAVVDADKPAETPKPSAEPSTTGKPESNAEPTESPTEKPQTTATPEPIQPPHTHEYTEAVTKQPTCTEDGVKTLTCLCGDVKTEEIPATGHDFVTQYQTLVHEALGHAEVTTIQTGTTKRTEYACGVCDARFDTAAGVQEHCKGTGDFDHAMARTIAYDYEEPVYEEVSTWVIDSPAWEEQVPVGSICSKCGALYFLDKFFLSALFRLRKKTGKENESMQNS